MAQKKLEPKIKLVKLSELNPAVYNPRTISDAALAGLAASIERFGCVEPIIVNTRGGRNIIIGGHQRFRVLQQQKKKSATCVCLDLLKKEEKLLNISLNNPEIQGQFIDSLAQYIDEMRTEVGDDKALLDLRIAQLQGQIKDRQLSYKEERLKPFRRTHILLSFTPDLLPQIFDHLKPIIETEGIEYEQGSN